MVKRCLALALIAGILVGCAAQSTRASTTPRLTNTVHPTLTPVAALQRPVLLVLGDSLTGAFGATTQAQGYAELVAAQEGATLLTPAIGGPVSLYGTSAFNVAL